MKLKIHLGYIPNLIQKHRLLGVEGIHNFYINKDDKKFKKKKRTSKCLYKVIFYVSQYTHIFTIYFREQTPSYSSVDVSLPPSEEVQHLRRQVGKLNRRVMAIELEMLQRQQRDKILYTLTLAYFILKAISWLNRN